jgi:hypothetical protein
MENEDSLPCSQESAIGDCPDPDYVSSQVFVCLATGP